MSCDIFSPFGTVVIQKLHVAGLPLEMGYSIQMLRLTMSRDIVARCVLDLRNNLRTSNCFHNKIFRSNFFFPTKSEKNFIEFFFFFLFHKNTAVLGGNKKETEAIGSCHTCYITAHLKGRKTQEKGRVSLLRHFIAHTLQRFPKCFPRESINFSYLFFSFIFPLRLSLSPFCSALRQI